METYLGVKTVAILIQAYFPGGTEKTKNDVLSENPQALLICKPSLQINTANNHKYAF